MYSNKKVSVERLKNKTAEVTRKTYAALYK